MVRNPSSGSKRLQFAPLSRQSPSRGQSAPAPASRLCPYMTGDLRSPRANTASTVPPTTRLNDPYPRTPKPDGLPMSSIPALDGIHELLLRAQRDLFVPLKIRDRTVSLQMDALPESFARRDLAMKLVRDGAWATHPPAFQAIQQWIEIHWNAELPTQRPPWNRSHRQTVRTTVRASARRRDRQPQTRRRGNPVRCGSRCQVRRRVRLLRHGRDA